MLIFWNARLVVLSTPKTGSTALAEALGPLAALSVERPPVLKHTPAWRYQRLVQPWLQNSAGGEPFTAVALMREPVDWLGSWYRYRQRASLDSAERSTRDLSFADFVEGYMSDPRPPFADVGAQARFLSGTAGAKLGVDRLFRYEAMEAFVAFLENRLDTRLKLPRVNVSPPGALDLPDATARRLRDYLAAEYALYNRLD